MGIFKGETYTDGYGRTRTQMSAVEKAINNLKIYINNFKNSALNDAISIAPGIGEIYDAHDVGQALDQKDYKSAAILAGLGILPGSLAGKMFKRLDKLPYSTYKEAEEALKALNEKRAMGLQLSKKEQHLMEGLQYKLDETRRLQGYFDPEYADPNMTKGWEAAGDVPDMGTKWNPATDSEVGIYSRKSRGQSSAKIKPDEVLPFKYGGIIKRR